MAHTYRCRNPYRNRSRHRNRFLKASKTENDCDTDSDWSGVCRAQPDSEIRQARTPALHSNFGIVAEAPGPVQ